MRVQAATVNPTDTLFRSGYHAQVIEGEPPYVPGMDASGTLDALGAGVELPDLAVGDAVVAIVVPTARTGGAYAEYVVVPANSVARAPAGFTAVEGATLPMNGMTALLALDVLDLRPGQTLAVTGAAGAFGGYVVQLAHAAGIRVVADAGPNDFDLVHSLGADIVVPRGEGFVDDALAENNGPVDAVADGALLGASLTPLIGDGGQLALVRPFDIKPERDIRIHEIYVRHIAQHRAKLDHLCRMAERGLLTLRVAETMPAEEAAKAHRRLAAGGLRGRLVLTFE